MHFYNFPYAFGGLFARGLYARYEQEGEAFVPVYCDLLSRFGSDTIANVTASVGIDVDHAGLLARAPSKACWFRFAASSSWPIRKPPRSNFYQIALARSKCRV